MGLAGYFVGAWQGDECARSKPRIQIGVRQRPETVFSGVRGPTVGAFRVLEKHDSGIGDDSKFDVSDTTI